MSRKRKLHLSEFLNKCGSRKSYKVTILSRNTHSYYNNITDCTTVLKDTETWKMEIHYWYIDQLRNSIYIELE